MPIPSQQDWNTYCQVELEALKPLLAELSITLDAVQPHLKGERFLMQAVTTQSGQKLILLGLYRQTTRVVIKATRDTNGVHELRHERTCRKELSKLKFAYNEFLTPEELYFGTVSGFTISVQRFIEQESSFIARPLSEQYFLALNALKAQEAARATTPRHLAQVQKTFGFRDAKTYLDCHNRFIAETAAFHKDRELAHLLETAHNSLTSLERRIEQYGGFLTHTDFVPHNFRIHKGKVYLLDVSSLRFGNKHEGWARFLNFMSLYNRDLEAALLTYVQVNRAPEEYESLHAMRLYRLTELIHYYTRTLPRSAGKLLTLNQNRVSFWSDALRAELSGERLSDQRVLEYQQIRDSLRSEEERDRQKDLH